MVFSLLSGLAMASVTLPPFSSDGFASPELPDVAAPIINGESATLDDYPMAGGLVYSADVTYQGMTVAEQMFMCSSTLIAPDVVLTAAHCLDEGFFDIYAQKYGLVIEPNALLWSRLPTLSIFAVDGISQGWPSDAVESIGTVMHEDFDLAMAFGGLSQNDDIGLIFLAEAVLDVPFAYLVTPSESDQVVVDAVVQIVGWGQTTSGQPTPDTYGDKMMGETTLSEIGDWEIRVGLLSSDTRKCHGDSGGPTFMDVDTDALETMRQIGITSHAYDASDCNVGGVDTNVAAYLDWIDAQMRAACADGTRVWCEEEGIPALPMKQTGTTTATTTGSETGAGETGLSNGDDAENDCSCAAISGGAMGLPLLMLPLVAIRRRQSLDDGE